MLLFTICNLVIGVVSIESARHSTGEFRLYNDIIWNNNPYERPVYNKSETITVEFDFHLHTVSRYTESQQQLLCTGWFDVSWSDQFLTWNSEMYDGVEFIRPPDSYVWKPDLVVSNSFQQLNHIGGDFVPLKVSSYGHVQWMTGDLFYLHCETDVLMYPFDSLKCSMEIVVWSYSTSEVDLKVRQSVAGTSSSNIGGQWRLKPTSITAKEKTFDNKPISHVLITLILDRRPVHFVFNFILPVLILSVLGTFVFLIPADSGEKISFAITIPLSYGVYMGFLTDMIPQSSQGISPFIIILGLTLTMSAVFVIVSIVSVRFCGQSESKPIRKTLQRFTIWVEKVDAFGRFGNRHKPAIEESGQLQELQAKTTQPVTWKRVSKALDLFFFWLLCIPSLVGIPITLIYIGLNLGF
ncbi:neuronal acetylcholine receptor subunit alpha-7-like [Haliotis rufescens]|uniref:neuronal acetylcholine receptor subunit alpha-7-like n=1 Tax=Haliotis rufescens TaxID=6454 RepID=UPI00201FABF1|nr:neuronal acetylcholine receptor subunit alpha-7-like [Haliotis rufescens]